MAEYCDCPRAVWAIGTGKTASPADAQAAAKIREVC